MNKKENSVTIRIFRQEKMVAIGDYQEISKFLSVNPSFDFILLRANII